MTAITALPQRVTLLDIIPRSRVRDVVAVFGFALATAGAAQISIPLGFTPVPITGQTFAVLLAGGALGANRGAISQFLYLFMGAVGLPFYADGASGWDVATGSTAGYLFGYLSVHFYQQQTSVEQSSSHPGNPHTSQNRVHNRDVPSICLAGQFIVLKKYLVENQHS